MTIWRRRTMTYRSREEWYASKGGWSLEVVQLLTGKWRAEASNPNGVDGRRESHVIGERLTLVMAQLAAERWRPRRVTSST